MSSAAEVTGTGEQFVATLTGFAGPLREEGLVVGTGDLLTFCAAAATLDATDVADLYWAGRASLVTRQADLAGYDRAFRSYFLDEAGVPEELAPLLRPPRETAAVLQVPQTALGKGEEQQQLVQLGLVGSDAQTLRAKAFAECTPQELLQLRRIMARLRLTPPRRRTRRSRRARRGRTPDLRRMARETLRHQGEPPPLSWRRRRLRPRRLVLILDVSGSMADYSRTLLQFAYSTARAADRVEVFCFGTRLTRITTQLRYHRVDDALRRAAETVVDWDGGTQIGASLAHFVAEWGRQGTARGAIVIVCSDGLDRGDPAELEAAMARLARLAHAIVWINPHAGGRPLRRADFGADAGFATASAMAARVPDTVGMTVVAPYLDLLLRGRDLAGLEQLVAQLATLG